jgi:hypothetical protein
MACGGIEESFATAGGMKAGGMRKGPGFGGGSGITASAGGITKETMTAAGCTANGERGTAFGGTAQGTAPGATTKGKRDTRVGGAAKRKRVTAAGGTPKEMRCIAAGGAPKGAGGKPSHAMVPGGAARRCTLPATPMPASRPPVTWPSNLGRSR